MNSNNIIPPVPTHELFAATLYNCPPSGEIPAPPKEWTNDADEKKNFTKLPLITETKLENQKIDETLKNKGK